MTFALILGLFLLSSIHNAHACGRDVEIIGEENNSPPSQYHAGYAEYSARRIGGTVSDSQPQKKPENTIPREMESLIADLFNLRSELKELDHEFLGWDPGLYAKIIREKASPVVIKANDKLSDLHNLEKAHGIVSGVSKETFYRGINVAQICRIRVKKYDPNRFVHYSGAISHATISTKSNVGSAR